MLFRLKKWYMSFKSKTYLIPKLVFYFLTLLFVSCGDVQKSADKSKTEQPLFESNLTEEDRMALANARGRSVELISIADLHRKMDHAKGKLHLFCFWKLYNNDSKLFVKNLRDVHRELGRDRFEITYINLDQQSLLKEINVFVRELGITEDIHILSEPSEGQLFANRDYNWDNQIPLLVLKNKSDGTNLFHQQSLEFEELIAFLQPFLLD